MMAPLKMHRVDVQYLYEERCKYLIRYAMFSQVPDYFTRLETEETYEANIAFIKMLQRYGCYIRFDERVYERYANRKMMIMPPTEAAFLSVVVKLHIPTLYTITRWQCVRHMRTGHLPTTYVAEIPRHIQDDLTFLRRRKLWLMPETDNKTYRIVYTTYYEVASFMGRWFVFCRITEI